MLLSSLRALLLLTATATIPAVVDAWGSLGHRTTTALALLYIHPRHPAHKLLATLLRDQDPTTAALFPDRIRYIPSFAYTAPWHYIDAQDNPPHSCNVNFTRDCFPDEGCVVTAIANHTARVSDLTLPLWQRGQSLRFMLHFFGDVHQPLHTENLDRGGNEIPVMFDGARTNLHSVWDTLMPVKMALLAEEKDRNARGRIATTQISRQGRLANETEAAFAWADFLYARYGNDGRVPERLEDVCVDDALGCALDWAGEANGWVCKYVLKGGVEFLQQQDLGEEYFEDAMPIIEEMLVKGGRRLAKWLMVAAEQADRAGKELETIDEAAVAELKR